MRYKFGDIEVLFKQVGPRRYRAVVRYRGRELHLKRAVVEYLDATRYRAAVNPYDESVTITISKSPPVAARISWRRSSIFVLASEEQLQHVARGIAEFAEAYMAAYRSNALDRIFHED
ncbi:MAG: hypothetical protein ABWJ97_05415 [Thermoproteus sp.]